MLIRLRSDYLETTNCEAIVTCNGQKIQSNKVNCWELTDDGDELIISIQLINATYNNKKGPILVCIVWILHFFSGYSRYLFGYPYDYILKIAVKNPSAVQNVDLHMNSYKCARPFAVSSQNCTILQNEYIAVSGYKWKWIASTVVPILALASFVIAIFFAIFLEHSLFTAAYGLGFFVLVGLVLYVIYIYKILNLSRVPR